MTAKANVLLSKREATRFVRGQALRSICFSRDWKKGSPYNSQYSLANITCETSQWSESQYPRCTSVANAPSKKNAEGFYNKVLTGDISYLKVIGVFPLELFS